MNDTMLGQARRALEQISANMKAKGLFVGAITEETAISIYVDGTAPNPAAWVGTLRVVNVHTEGFDVVLELRERRKRTYSERRNQALHVDAIERAIMAAVGETVLAARRESEALAHEEQHRKALVRLLGAEGLTIDACHGSDAVLALGAVSGGVALAIDGTFDPETAWLILHAIAAAGLIERDPKIAAAIAEVVRHEEVEHARACSDEPK